MTHYTSAPALYGEPTTCAECLNSMLRKSMAGIPWRVDQSPEPNTNLKNAPSGLVIIGTGIA